MKKKIETRGMFFLLFFIIFIVENSVAYSQVYHIDPNSVQGLIPANLKQTNVNGLFIYNKNNQDFKILISKDDKNWDAVPVKANGDIQYPDKIIFIMLYTTKEKYKHYKLFKGYSYIIKWDNVNKQWILE